MTNLSRQTVWSQPPTSSALNREFDNIVNTWNAMNSGSSSLSFMVGVVTMYAGSTVPTGWLTCDGSAVSRTTYADLFAALGTTWGTGDGSTTFNLPDARGVFPKGGGTTARSAGKDSSGTFYAATLGAYSTDQMQGHFHKLTSGSVNAYTATDGAGTFPTLGTGTAGNLTLVNSNAAITDGTNGTPRVGHTSEPQSFGITFIIKF